MAPRKVELEAALESRCVAKIEALGGVALKLSIPGVRGFPDRTILMQAQGDATVSWKAARGVWFAEFKRLKTGSVSAQQHRWRVLLHQLGFGVYFVSTDAEFDAALQREMGR